MISKFTLRPDDQTKLSETSLSEAIRLFDQHGTLWIENVLSRPFVIELQKAYTDRYASLSRKKLRERYAAVGEDRFMITVEVRCPFDSVALTDNPRLMPLLRHFLGEDCVISSYGSVVAFPGAAGQQIHFDYPPLFESESLCCQLPPHAITLVVPLIDLNEQTGSTALWEGSHHRVGARDQLQQLCENSSFEGAALPKPKMGDVYLMDFRLIHGGTPNLSDHARPILYIVYSRPWFREDDNFAEQPPIQLSKKQYGKLTKSQKRLFSRSKPIKPVKK